MGYVNKYSNNDNIFYLVSQNPLKTIWGGGGEPTDHLLGTTEFKHIC